MSEIDELELEAEKRELRRLLESAKDEERKEVIRKSLASLDEMNDTYTPINTLKSVGSSGNLLAQGQLEITASRARPFSSTNKRRPSLSGNSLLAIPENRTTHLPGDNLIDMELTEEDISHISSTSHDPRYPPINLFNNPDLNKNGWIPTGLIPQVLTVGTNVPWRFSKIEIICEGVEEISLNVMSSRSVSVDTYFKFAKNNTNNFVFDASNAILHEYGSSTNTRLKKDSLYDSNIGNKLLISFNKASKNFFVVKSIKILGSHNLLWERDRVGARPPLTCNY